MNAKECGFYGLRYRWTSGVFGNLVHAGAIRRVGRMAMGFNWLLQ